MKFSEVRDMAKRMGIKTGGLTKTKLIRSIQEAESNIPCFGTDRVETCNESACLWREDCLSLNSMSRVHNR
jgi:hypothetical protein